MKNILIIGASSFIGLNLIKKIRQNALIYATYNSTKKLVRKKNIKFFQFNLYNPNFNNIPENIDCIIFLAHPIIQGTDKLKLFFKNLLLPCVFNISPFINSVLIIFINFPGKLFKIILTKLFVIIGLDLQILNILLLIFFLIEI